MYFSFSEYRAVNTNHSQMQHSHSNSYPGWRSPLFNYKWSMPFSSITVTENRENAALVNSKCSCKQEAWSGHPVLIMLWLSACARVFVQACPLFCQNDHLLPSLPPARWRPALHLWTRRPRNETWGHSAPGTRSLRHLLHHTSILFHQYLSHGNIF